MVAVGMESTPLDSPLNAFERKKDERMHSIGNQSLNDDTTCVHNGRLRSTTETSSSSEERHSELRDRLRATSAQSQDENEKRQTVVSNNPLLDLPSDHLDSDDPQQDVLRRNRNPFSLVHRVRPSFFTRRIKKTTETATETTATAVETTETVHQDSTDEDESFPSTTRTSSFPTLPSIASFRRNSVLRRIRSNSTVEKSERLDPSTVQIEFKSVWNEKLKHTMEKMAHRTTPQSKAECGAVVYEKERPPEQDLFHILLKLYAHQDVIEELYTHYEYNTEAFEFYIPQLCTFLIHGKYAKQHQLEFFLMSRSGECLLFAHRLIWFLTSFCKEAREYQSESLSVTASTEEENTQSDLLSAIHQHASVPAMLMHQGLTMVETTSRNAALRRASVFDNDEVSSLPTTLKEDDDALATYLQDKRRRTLEVVQADANSEEHVTMENATPAFARALTDLAQRLIPVPLAERNTELRKGLELIHDDFLPSNVIYLPIGNKFHRVKAIQLEECFTFSTKERVPYFMCVEVVDYAILPEDQTRNRASLLTRKKSGRKFGIKLPFKTKLPTEPESTTAPLPGPPRPMIGKYPSGHQLTGSSKIILALNEILNSPSTALALTPSPSPISVGTDMIDDGDDEKEEDTTDIEQKKRLGQWNLPRTRGRKQRDSERPVDASAKATRFEKFYSAWFAKRSDADVADEEDDRSTPETLSEHDCSDNEQVSDKSVQPSLDPVAAKRDTIIQPTYDTTSSDDDGRPRQKGRYTSESLDFTDSTVWKDNYELGDIVNDTEGGVNSSEKSPIETPEHLSDGEEDDEMPVIVFRERWSEKQERIRQISPFANHPGWRLLPVIVKSNDDLRQEQFAAQLIAQCDLIFRGYKLPLQLRPYNVIATSATTGLIEAVPDTVSLDSLKRNDPGYTTLLEFYYRLFGEEDTSEFHHARRNFVESLAAYSILCYVFQIKDRHNGNILLDTVGHVIHIDFGFLLTNSPGSNLGFETAPFKLTDEFVELMGGPRSAAFRYFRSLCIRAYLALRRNMERIVLLVEMMLIGNEDLPCFAGGKRVVIEELKERLKPGARTSECQVYVNELIDRSINNWRTRWYDKYQRACVGIM